MFQLLTRLKKPIVGHNCFLDLMVFIQNFEKDLPNDYNEFKKLTVQHFPTVYDTKFLSFEMRNFLSEDLKWESNGLEQLYDYFRNKKGRHLVMNSPRIEIHTDNTFDSLRESDSFHNAGWDSYCTGYCFIRMAHFFATKNYEKATRVLMSSEHINAVMKFKNKINIIRATISHVVCINYYIMHG